MRSPLVRYTVRPISDDLHEWRIWDEVLKDFCGLPDAGGRHQVLEFSHQDRATDWIKLCKAAGLDICMPHPGLRVKVYQARHGSSRLELVRSVHAEPDSGPMVDSRWPLCACPRCERRRA